MKSSLMDTDKKHVMDSEVSHGVVFGVKTVTVSTIVMINRGVQNAGNRSIRTFH